MQGILKFLISYFKPYQNYALHQFLLREISGSAGFAGIDSIRKIYKNFHQLNKSDYLFIIYI